MIQSQKHAQATSDSATATPAQDTTPWTSRRRDFLRILGAGTGIAALAACGGDGGNGGGFNFNANAGTRADQLRAALTADTGFWRNVEDMFTLDPAKTFMNIGTAGSMPKLVLDLFDEGNRAKARDSMHGYTDVLDQRKALAPSFGVDPDELAISANTSSGMCHAILGLDWKSGDVIVTTNHEHFGGDAPLRIAQARFGVEVSRVALPVGNDQRAADYAHLFEQRILELRNAGKHVRAMMWSSPTYKTGTMLPIEELMAVVRKYELISIVDGAHLPGMMDYDYSSLGMDFMSGAGHKWQCGPGSTGILIMRNKIRASNPLPLPKWFPVHTSYFDTPMARTTNATPTYDIAAQVSACGSMHLPLFNGLVKASQLWDQIGRKKIETYDLAMSSYLKERIAEKWGVDRLYSPKDDAKLLSAMTSFNPFVNPADITQSAKTASFVARLLSDYAPGFVIRSVDVPVIASPQPHAVVRISTHVWTDATDIDRLVDAMWATSRAMA
jgi:isopenicillin-N epimerase